MKTFIVFISAYFTVAGSVHFLRSETNQSQRIMAWVALTMSLILSCGILFALPGMAFVTVLPVGLCALGGVIAAQRKSVLAKLASIVVCVGLAVAFHVQFARTAPRHYLGADKVIQCQSNLKTISSALASYRDKSGGKNPDSLEQLVPDYARSLPQCPSALSMSYKLVPDSADPVVFCSGRSHAGQGLPENHPRANGVMNVDLGIPPDTGFDWYEFR